MGVEGEGQRHAEDMKPPESGITVCKENIHLGGFSSQYLNKLDAIIAIATQGQQDSERLSLIESP